MKLLAYFRSLAASLFDRSRAADDMDEELRSHIQHRADDLERSGLIEPKPNGARVLSLAAMNGSKKSVTKQPAERSSNRWCRTCAMLRAHFANRRDSLL